MNKKILTFTTLSLLASSVAMAQSSLTLYGNIDASVVSASGIGSDKERRTSFGEGNWAPLFGVFKALRIWAVVCAPCSNLRVVTMRAQKPLQTEVLAVFSVD